MKSLNRSLLALAAILAMNAATTAQDNKNSAPGAKPTSPAINTAEVEVIRDIAYTGNSTDDRQKLDLYLPKGKKNYAVVLFLHGGGFSKGDRKDAAQFGATLAKQGIGVAAAGYRLSPDAKHPQQIQDVAKAFAWLKQNAEKHGWRQDALFVSGHSAGGQLAALLATDEQYLKAEKLALSDIRGAIVLSGAYRVPDNKSDVFGDDASRKAASPISHVKPGIPAFFLVYADKDLPDRDRQTKEFAAALIGAKDQVTVFEARDRDHVSLFTQIATDDSTGISVIEFIRRQAGTK